MSETSQGVGRVVVLVLFTVLFVAAWRGDHSVADRSDARLARAVAARKAVSTVVVSAESIGDLLPSCAAARLAPADQTNGLTLHMDRGVSTALASAISVPGTGDAPLVENTIVTLGAQLAICRNRPAEQSTGFLGSAAILSGSWLESSGPSAPDVVHAPHVEVVGARAIDEAGAEGLDRTARVLR
jgi:hypothetical protein